MSRKDITKLYKRFLITFLLTLPALIGIGFLLYKKVSDAVMVVIFVVFAGTVLAIEELVHYKLAKKRQLQREQLQSQPATSVQDQASEQKQSKKSTKKQGKKLQK